MTNLLLFAPSLLLACAFIFLMNLSTTLKNSWRLKIFSVLIAIIIFSIHINGLSIAEYWHGLFDTLSITTIYLAVIFIIRQLKIKIDFTKIDRYFLSLLAVLGLILFISTLYPVWNFDLYDNGYSPVVLAGLLAIVGIGCWIKQTPLTAILLLLILASYYGHLLPSDNLWNYLLDPFVVIFGITYILKSVVKGVIKLTNTVF